MRRLLPRLKRNERGAAIIELALTAPILALMTIGVVDMSNAFSRKLALEQATQRGIEKVMQTTGDTTVDDTLKLEVAAQAGIPEDDADEKVSVTYRLECIATDGTVTEKADFDYDECGETEKQGRYIEIEAHDEYEPMFPIHFMGIDDDGTYHISARAGMRTPSWEEEE